MSKAYKEIFGLAKRILCIMSYLITFYDHSLPLGISLWLHVTCKPPLSKIEQACFTNADYFYATDGHFGEYTIINSKKESATQEEVESILQKHGREPIYE